jgi:hypothetical protein
MHCAACKGRAEHTLSCRTSTAASSFEGDLSSVLIGSLPGQSLEYLMYRSWFEDRKITLARRARRGDSNYLHAQLILAGQKVAKDTIAGTSHSYYFDCGCVRRFQLNAPANKQESLEPCRKHGGLISRVRPSRA